MATPTAMPVPPDADAAILARAASVELAHVEPFVGTFFRPSCWWFWHVDYASLVILPGLAYVGDGTSAGALYVRCALQLLLTGALAAAYVARKPYQRALAWMLPAKLLSLVITCCLAALSLVVELVVMDARGAGAGGSTGTAAAGGGYGALVAVAAHLEVATLILSCILCVCVLAGFSLTLVRDTDRATVRGRIARGPPAEVVVSALSGRADDGASGGSGLPTVEAASSGDDASFNASFTASADVVGGVALRGVRPLRLLPRSAHARLFDSRGVPRVVAGPRLVRRGGATDGVA